jgi:5-methylcytosine-specific restriction endonuclease McrA
MNHTAVCEFCKIEFITSRGRFCSRSCATKSQWITGLANSEKFIRPLREVTCSYCGTVFQTFRLQAKFCSKICAATQQCLDGNGPGSNSEWTDERRRIIGEHSSKNNAGPGNGRFVHGEGWQNRLWKEAVIARDGWECLLCKSPGDGLPESQGRSDGDLHAHHIYPRDTYPLLQYEPRNGVILCRSCHFNTEGQLSVFAISLLELET